MYRHHEYKTGLELKDYYPGVVLEPTVKVFDWRKVKIGEGTYIGHDVKLYGYPLNSLSITIGEDSWIGANTIIHGAGGVKIGNKVGIGPDVMILSSEHIPDGHPCVMSNPILYKAVEIQDYADLGAGCKICPGALINKGAIVGMGSVVTDTVPAYEIWVGSPARFLRERRVETLPNVIKE